MRVREKEREREREREKERERKREREREIEREKERERESVSTSVPDLYECRLPPPRSLQSQCFLCLQGGHCRCACTHAHPRTQRHK
jgi:hypothetical protein